MADLPNPYSVTPRKPLTDKQRLMMFIDAKGICCICGHRIDGVREMWDEHEVPLWAGGSNEKWNRAPAHRACAIGKTAKEAKARARGRSFAEFHHGAKRSKSPMPCGRRSPWKRKFDGSVVRRDEE